MAHPDPSTNAITKAQLRMNSSSLTDEQHGKF